MPVRTPPPAFTPALTSLLPVAWVLRQAGEMNGTSTIWSSLHLATENGFWFLSQLLTSLGPSQEDTRKPGSWQETQIRHRSESNNKIIFNYSITQQQNWVFRKSITISKSSTFSLISLLCTNLKIHVSFVIFFLTPPPTRTQNNSALLTCYSHRFGSRGPKPISLVFNPSPAWTCNSHQTH